MPCLELKNGLSSKPSVGSFLVALRLTVVQYLQLNCRCSNCQTGWQTLPFRHHYIED
jgi:hypothetical protein